jgi:hypothetical protein
VQGVCARLIGERDTIALSSLFARVGRWNPPPGPWQLHAAARGQPDARTQIAADSVDVVERGHHTSCGVDPGYCSGARNERAAKHRSAKPRLPGGFDDAHIAGLLKLLPVLALVSEIRIKNQDRRSGAIQDACCSICSD